MESLSLFVLELHWIELVSSLRSLRVSASTLDGSIWMTDVNEPFKRSAVNCIVSVITFLSTGQERREIVDQRERGDKKRWLKYR